MGAVTVAGTKISILIVLTASARTKSTQANSVATLAPARYTPGRETASATTATTSVLAIGTVAIAVVQNPKNNTVTASNARASTRKYLKRHQNALAVVKPTSPSKVTAFATTPITTARAIGTVVTAANSINPRLKSTAVCVNAWTQKLKLAPKRKNRKVAGSRNSGRMATAMT